MDSTNYKVTQTCRGLKYNYYFAPAQANKPTILFIHGFPSTSRDWTKQVSYFQPRGYGIVVPDLLGYGGTDKPRNSEAYRASLMTRDIIDILDEEGLEKVVVISHDWGTWFTSRLMNFFPERFHGAAFLASGYMVPEPWDYDKMNSDSKKEIGYDVMGYHSFMASDGADKIMEDHFATFFGVLFPHDPDLWKTDFAPAGRFKKALLQDKRFPLAPYLTDEDWHTMRATLLGGGLAGPLNWYRQLFRGIEADDLKRIPEGRATLLHPTFFGGCSRDYICMPTPMGSATAKHCKNLTSREYDADHWVQFSHADELNPDLEEWIVGPVGLA